MKLKKVSGFLVKESEWLQRRVGAKPSTHCLALSVYPSIILLLWVLANRETHAAYERGMTTISNLRFLQILEKKNITKSITILL